ncbi:MAG: response regulator [bacterium]|nr:response regulator [bacterium]
MKTELNKKISFCLILFYLIIAIPTSAFSYQNEPAETGNMMKIIIFSILIIVILYILYRFRVRAMSRQIIDLRKEVKENRQIFEIVNEEAMLLSEKLDQAYEEKLKAEKIKYTLYKLSESVTVTQDLNSLYKSIRTALSEIINTENFYIALYDENKDITELVYFADEKDEAPYDYNVSRSGTLIAEVIRSRSSVFLDKEQLVNIYSESGETQSGTKPLVWLGVPLSIQNKMIGVMAVQSYTDAELFEEKDLDLLEVVSRQVALSIEVKRMEDVEKKIHDKLLNTQKMESIGRLAGGVAHEFNNIMTGIMGYAELLKLRFGDKDSFEGEAAGIIISSIERASNLTKQLLGFARKGKFNPKKLTINEIIVDVLKIMDKVINKEVLVKASLSDDLPYFEGDKVQIEQVFLNLLINANDAMPNGGNILLRTDLIKINEINQMNYPELNSGDYIKVTLSDTGIGIPRKILGNIFEPFFSTKGIDKGTGLGLATVYGIVKNHHGNIHVDSVPGMGTSFFVYLPSMKNGNGKEHHEAEKELTAGKGVVFVVDDEEYIRSFTDKALQYIGFNVMTADDSFEALSIYRKKHAEIDLILLDLKMPNVSGYEIFKKLIKINPDAKIVLMSGYSESEGASELIGEGALEFIQKPFKMVELSNTISKYLKN